jgi:serine/threonine-protein kinase PknG
MPTKTSACRRTGCTGTYAPDGYCDECGHKAPPPDGVGVGQHRVATSAAFVTPHAGAGLGGASTGGGTGTRSRTAGRGGLGANLVTMAPIPLRDPTTAVMADPQVPESQRFCAKCGGPWGAPARASPAASRASARRTAARSPSGPRLSPGELVDQRYEILGALAHGGLGWIYLARDRNISGPAPTAGSSSRD